MPRSGVSRAGLLELDTDVAPAVVRLAGDWGQAERLPVAADIEADLISSQARSVVIDGSDLKQPHPRVAGFIRALGSRLNAQGLSVEYRRLGPNLTALIEIAGRAEPDIQPVYRRNLFEHVGRRARDRYHEYAEMLAFVGRAALATPRFVTGRSQSRWQDFVGYVQETGAASLPVVTVVNLLVGAVLGFVGAIQLQKFGAGLYLADLVGISVAREMAALMTAFVIAGRVGATFAAHLATMQTNEEVDALRMTGVSPFDFLVMPRLAALSLMMPLLYLYAAAVGIVGGMLVAQLVLGMPPAAFIHRLHAAVAVRQFAIGFVKSGCFGVLIALTSCYLGLNAGRNAAEVGRAATRTVVTCIIGIIIIDAVFALGTNALGI